MQTLADFLLNKITFDSKQRMLPLQTNAKTILHLK